MTSIPLVENDDDPIVARLTAETQAREARLQGALHQAIDTNPDQYAATRRTAGQLGYPTPVVEALPNLVKQAQVNQITQTVAEAPVLKRKLADDAEFAKLAHDDTGNLSAVERTLGFVKNVGRDMVAGLSGFNEGFYGVAQSAADIGAGAIDPLVGTILPENPFAKMSAAASAQRNQEKAIKNSLQKARGDISATEAGIHSGIESATQSLLTLPLALLTRNPNVLTGTMAAQTGGQSYGDAIDAGKPVSQALPFAASQAMVEYATEQLPAIKLLEGLKNKSSIIKTATDFLAREVPGEQVATALQDLNEWAVLHPDKPFSEYLKDRPDAAYQTLIATLVGGSIQVGTGKAIEAVVSRFSLQDQIADQAQQHKDTLTQLDQLAASSLLRARDPATFQQFIASAAEDGPVQDVYIDAKTIVASGFAQQLAQVSPAVREQLAEAESTGGSVRIPLDEYTATIAGTELNQPLIDHIKLDPNGMTFAESEQFQQTYQADFNKQVEQTIAAQQGDDNFKAAVAEVKDTVKQQLNAAGHTSPAVNDTYATLASAYYAVRAAQLGVSPKELFDQHPLTVSGERVAGGSLDQGAALEAANSNWQHALRTASPDRTEFVPKAWTPTVLKEMQLKSGKLAFPVRVLKEVLSRHPDVPGSVIENLPKHIHDPLYVIGYKDGGLRMVLDATTTKGEPIVVGVSDGRVHTVTPIHDSAEMSGQDRMLQMVAAELGKKTKVYVRNKTALDEARAVGLRTPGHNSPSSLSKLSANVTHWDSLVKKYGSDFYQAAYHGSPYQFDKFSLEHLGKGEGAQAYGWGLYFAGNKEVAEYYKNYLSNRTTYIDRENGEYFIRSSSPEDLTAPPLAGPFDTRMEALAYLGGGKHLKGQLYRVDIPEDDTYLLWDKPLSEQSESVKAALNKIPVITERVGKVLLAGKTGDEIYTALANAHQLGKLEGEGSGFSASQKAASKYLHSLGINGIKYLDGTSRNAGEGNYNYVVFDDNAIRIVETFYQNGGNRGAYSPDTNTITLLKNADLSTFLHELGHAFLAMDTQFAAQVLAKGTTTEGEQQMLNDMQTLFNWFGIEGDLTQQLAHWNSLSVDQQRASHEKFAEGFEAYLFTGKAPSLELQPLFQRFRAWLSSVYRNLTNYLRDAGDTLTPEVTSVMDRMLATPQQVQRAQQARGMSPLFATAEEAGMTPEAFAKYQQDNTLGSQDAITELEAKSLKDMTWTTRLKERTVARLNKEANALRKEVKAQVTEEVNAEPVYTAMRFLKRGETVSPDGEQIKAEAGHRLSIVALQELYPEGELSQHPDWKKLGYGGYGMLAEDGLHPDLVAEMFGFKSGDELVRALLDAQPRREVIDAVTDQRMLEQHGEVATADAISKAADEAIHNDVRTRVLATELAGLQKALGSALALSRMAKEYAQQVVGKTKVKDLRPNKFAADAARNGKAAEMSMRKGDRPEAITQKRNQLVNHATTKAAYEAAAEVKQIAQRFRQITTAKTDNLKNTHNLDLVNAARAILAEYGVGQRTQNAREYLDLVKNYDPELYTALEPDIIEAQQNAKELNALTVDELRTLRDQVESLWYLARREKQVEIDGKLVDREQVVKGLSDRLDELGLPDTVPGEGKAVTEAEKAQRMLQGARAAMRRVENWVDRMDDGKISGAFRQYIFTPISEAADQYRADATKYIKAYRDLLKSIEPTLKAGRIAAPELGYTFGYSKGDAGMSELLHALLHTGNESNKRKLLLGRGWAAELEDGSLDTRKWDSFIARMISEGKLDKPHFDFAQGVWDLLEETKPLAQKTHREVFGRYFAEVTADSFTNQFGTYRGGYVPAITDTYEVQDAAINAAREDANANNAYMFPATSRGFTKARVEYNRPLALDLRLIPQHLDKVLMFAHMERFVRDVQRTLKAVQGKLNRYDAVAYTDLLLPWLNRAAKQIVSTPSTGWAGKAADRFFSTMRSRAGMATMFANVSNALQQITGFSITLLKVKPTHLRQAMVQYLKSPGALSDAVAELSPFMKNRLEGEIFSLRNEIEDMLLNPSKYEQTKTWTQKHAYFLQAMFQNTVDVISWQGAYNQALAEGQSEADAVRSANSAVRETQGSLQPEDVSRWETGPAWARIFTQFSSYFNMQANLLGTEFAKVSQDLGMKKGAGKALYIFLMGFLVPVYLSEAIVQGMRGGGGDGDDEYLDEWLSFIFGAPLRNAAAMVPIAGPLAQRVAAGFTQAQYDDRLASAPAVAALESAGRTPYSVYKALVDDGSQKIAIKDSLTLISMITGAPVSALGKPFGYAADVHQGNVMPTSEADAIRGLITGTASADSKR